MSSFPLPLAPPLPSPRPLLRSPLLPPLSRLGCRVRRVTPRRPPLAALPLASLCPLFPSPPAPPFPSLSRLCCRVRRVTTRRSPLAALPLASLCPLFPSPTALLSPLPLPSFPLSLVCAVVFGGLQPAARLSLPSSPERFVLFPEQFPFLSFFLIFPCDNFHPYLSPSF